MTPDLPPLVERTVRRLISAFAPERIALFGSFAKRTTHIASDVDLLVVMRSSENRGCQERRARQLAADCFPEVDIVFATVAEVAEADNARSPFLHSILGRAITLYERSSTNCEGRCNVATG
jgi:predicted nucleotidyltransferase